MCFFGFIFIFPSFVFTSERFFFITNDCGGGGVFLLSFTSRYTFLSYPSCVYVHPFLLWSLLLLLVSAFLTFILAGLVFGFLFFPLYFTVWSGPGYRIDLHDNSLLLSFLSFYFCLFCIAPFSSLLPSIHPSIKTTLYVPDTTCYDLCFDFFFLFFIHYFPLIYSTKVSQWYGMYQ